MYMQGDGKAEPQGKALTSLFASMSGEAESAIRNVTNVQNVPVVTLHL